MESSWEKCLYFRRLFYFWKANRKDSLHPDYVPSLFTFSNQQSDQTKESKVKRYENLKRRKIMAEVSQQVQVETDQITVAEPSPVDSILADAEENKFEENDAGELFSSPPPAQRTAAVSFETPSISNSSLLSADRGFTLQDEFSAVCNVELVTSASSQKEKISYLLGRWK